MTPEGGSMRIHRVWIYLKCHSKEFSYLSLPPWMSIRILGKLFLYKNWLFLYKKWLFYDVLKENGYTWTRGRGSGLLLHVLVREQEGVRLDVTFNSTLVFLNLFYCGDIPGVDLCTLNVSFHAPSL
jgi:hypothetical protein